MDQGRTSNCPLVKVLAMGEANPSALRAVTNLESLKIYREMPNITGEWQHSSSLSKQKL